MRDLRRASGSAWADRLHWSATTGSTNADVRAAALRGEAEGLVIGAEHQGAGRGRLDRGWDSPSGSGLLFSLLLRPPPQLPAPAWGWLPLLTGVAVLGAVRAAGAEPVRLKWPNDLVVPRSTRTGAAPGKVAGILLERVSTPDGAVAVVGVGINVDLRDLTTATVTSVAQQSDSDVDRAELLAAVLCTVEERYRAWVDVQGLAEMCGLARDYREVCATIGSGVRLALPGGQVVEGTARGVDSAGRLLVQDVTGVHAYAAGDVVHTRPTGGP